MLVEKSAWDYIKVMKLDRFLEGHNGFVAGGCFKNIFMDEKIKDIDIFFMNEKDWQEADKYYTDSEDYYDYYENEKVKAYKNKHNQVAVELIRTIYGTPTYILNSFDFTIAKFAYFTDEIYNEFTDEYETKKFCLLHKDFFEHLALKRTVIDDKIPFPISTFERMIRYTNYGFYPCRETKKKIINAIHSLPVVPDVSMGLYNGLD